MLCPALRLPLPLSLLVQLRLPAALLFQKQLPRLPKVMYPPEVIYLPVVYTVLVLESLQSQLLYIPPLLLPTPLPLYQTQLFRPVQLILALLICTLRLHPYLQRLQLQLLVMGTSTHHSLQGLVQGSVDSATIITPTHNGANSLLEANLRRMDLIGTFCAATSSTRHSPMSLPSKSTPISTMTTGTTPYQS